MTLTQSMILPQPCNQFETHNFDCVLLPYQSTVRLGTELSSAELRNMIYLSVDPLCASATRQ